MSDDLIHLMIFLGVFTGAPAAAAAPAPPQPALAACAQHNGADDAKAPADGRRRARATLTYRKEGSDNKDI